MINELTNYTILNSEILSEGAYSKVYKILDKKNQKHLALKIVP